MQSVSAELTAACQASGQRPCTIFEVSWDGTGAFDAAMEGAGWTNETAYLETHTGALQINPPGESLVAAGDVGTLNVVLQNATGRFSWRRIDSALYQHIGGPAGLTGKAVRLWQGYITASGAEYVRVFTGVIAGWQESSEQAIVTLDCRDWGFQYLQNKLSTVIYENKLPSAWIETVGNLAGIDSADMNLDSGIYRIPFVWMDDESAVEEMWLAAEADGGLAFFDQLGILRFVNALAWVGAASQWTFNETDYSAVAPNVNPDAIATKVIVEWASRYRGPVTQLYQMDRQVVIGPRGEAAWQARFNYPALTVYQPSSADPYNDFYAVSGGGRDMSNDAIPGLGTTWSQHARMSVFNFSYRQTARLTFCQVRGEPLMGGPAEQVEADADPAPYSYERIRSVRGNEYVQTLEQAQGLANLLALRCRRARPVWTLTGVPGVPQLELGDRITFVNRWETAGASVWLTNDSGVHLANDDGTILGHGTPAVPQTGIVVGIRWQGGSAAGFVQDLDVLADDDLAAYDNYFQIGVSKVGGVVSGSETGYGRTYY